MELISINGEREVLGRNAAVKIILAKGHCPACALLPAEHNDEQCAMRYTENTTHQEEGWLP